MTKLSVLGLFRRKNGKWHDVRWRNGPRRIFMSLQFAADGTVGDVTPVVDRLPPADEDGDMTGHLLADEAPIIREIQVAVAEYNRMNVCALKVAGVRYRATEGTEPADYGTATRKLLNLL